MSLTLNVDNISRVSSHNFQGVVIDETLKFEVHIKKVCTKVSQSIDVFRRVSNMVLDNVPYSLYYALIYSRIIYAICAWESAHPTALNSLKSLAKKAISMQNNTPNRPHRSVTNISF